MPARLRIGFIGLGNMGMPMSRRVLARGLALSVWSRDPAKVAPLLSDGAASCASPAELLRTCDIVGLCVTDHHAVEEVCFGSGGLAHAGPSAGKAILDFSSIDPEVCPAIAQRMLEATGAAWVDCPVSGGVPAAENGSLIVFAGGDAEDIAKGRPLLDAVSQRVTHMGPTGAGQATKVCNQMIVSVNVMVLAETFATARKAGVDVNALTGAFAGGFADSRPLQIFGPRMAARRYTPRQSAIAIMGKDIALGQKMARRAGVATPLSALAASLYQDIRARGDLDVNGDVSQLVELYEIDK